MIWGPLSPRAWCYITTTQRHAPSLAQRVIGQQWSTMSLSKIRSNSSTQVQLLSPLLSLESPLLRVFKPWVKSPHLDCCDDRGEEHSMSLLCVQRTPPPSVPWPHPDSGCTSVVDHESDFTFWLCHEHCHGDWAQAQRIINKGLFSNKYQNKIK